MIYLSEDSFAKNFLYFTVCSQQITDLTASAEYPAGTSVSISCALDRAPPTDGVVSKK